jgi:hypothetical protein
VDEISVRAGDPFVAAGTHDDTVEAHYAGLERPCACLEGWVFVGYIDEYGEEREASYRCRRCLARAVLS